MNQEQFALAADQLRRQGKLDAALALYERIYNDNPTDLKTLAIFADALVASRQAARALEVLNATSTSSGSSPNSYSAELTTAKAKALLALQRRPEALELFRTVVEQHPTWADGWNNLGCCLLELGRDAEASARFRRAIALNPRHVEATLGLSRTCKRHGDLQQSRVLLENLLNQVDHRDARHELVAVLLRLGDTTTALTQAKQLVEAAEASIDDRMLLGRAYFLAGDVDAYIACLDAIPNQIWKGVSTESLSIGTLAESGRIEQARQRLSKLLERDPGDPNARLVEARDLLSQGEFAKGWRAYAHRLRIAQNQVHFKLEPNWDGQPLKGKSVLVLGEQGVGDVCYFSRFLKPLLADNPDTALIAEPRLLPLLQSTYPELHTFCDPEQINLLPSPLVRISLGSLPLLYGSSGEQIAALDHGLKPREADLISMRQRLALDSHHPRTLGISLLAGRPADEYQQRKRSLPIRAVLEQLVGLPITLVDLQHHGHPPEFHQEAERLGLQVLQYPELTDNLGLLAAAITAMDGVLTSQQSNAHLCGALGKPGITLLPPGCHFVFGEQTHHTWYPSLEVIRADQFGCWDVIEQELPERFQAWLG